MWKVQSQAVRELVFTLADVPFTDVQLRLHVQRKETFSSEAFFAFGFVVSLLASSDALHLAPPIFVLLLSRPSVEVPSRPFRILNC